MLMYEAKLMAQKMNENNPQPTTSKGSLSKKVEIDFDKAKWVSSSSRKRKGTSSKKDKKAKEFKSPAKQTKIEKYFSQEIIDSPSPSPRKRRAASTKVFKKHKYLSPSAKIDAKIPKVEDLLRDREESEKLKQIDKLIKKSSSQFLKELRKVDTDSPEKPKIDEIDCKHLTMNQLNRRFKKDFKYLDGIFHETVYSKRHELYKKQMLLGNNNLKEDLRVSESLGVFTSDQLVYIVSLFRERYDNGNKYKYSDYYFKVLLPEYCLKLFMDCHKMSNEEALEYLKNVPVPDLFGLIA